MTEAESSSCSRLLERLTTGADGKALELLRLQGDHVPADVHLYVCKRTFVAIQVRAKVADHPEGVVHDYALDPAGVCANGRGGVYELQCSRSKHHVQVKVQPALGMEDVFPRYSEDPTGPALAALLDEGRGELWPLLGLYYLLKALVANPAQKGAPLAAGYPESTEKMDWLLKAPAMLDQLVMKCQVFNRSYGSPPTLELVDPAKPKTRGMLLKAFFEVKLLLIRAITQIRFQGESMLSESEFEVFEKFMSYVYTDCCKGGVDSQYLSLEESAEELRHLICGAGAKAAPAAVASSAGAGAVAEGLQDMERSQMLQLRSTLAQVLEHLGSAGEGLDEANLLAGGQWAAERSTLTELTVHLKRHLDDTEERAKSLGAVDAPEGTEAAAKRLKTE